MPQPGDNRGAHGDEFVRAPQLRRLRRASVRGSVPRPLEVGARGAYPNVHRRSARRGRRLLRRCGRRPLVARLGRRHRDGHAPPPDPLAKWLPERAPRYLRNPWSPSELQRIGPDDRVLVLGTGLTAIDVALALEQQGHRAPIQLVSRRGLLPQRAPAASATAAARTARVVARSLGRGDLRAMVRIVRQTAALAAERGLSWHAVQDALRPITPRLWSSCARRSGSASCGWSGPAGTCIGTASQPAVAERVAAARGRPSRSPPAASARRRRTTAASSSKSRRARGGALQARSRRLDRQLRRHGLSRASCRPFERQLLARGALLPDPLGLGLRHGRAAAPRSAGTARCQVLYVLGPGCRPNLWEHTAVPGDSRAGHWRSPTSCSAAARERAVAARAVERAAGGEWRRCSVTACRRRDRRGTISPIRAPRRPRRRNRRRLAPCAPRPLALLPWRSELGAVGDALGGEVLLRPGQALPRETVIASVGRRLRSCRRSAAQVFDRRVHVLHQQRVEVVQVELGGGQRRDAEQA